MIFSDILDHPTETTLVTWIIGILLSEDLPAAELAVFGRLIIDIGEALVTRAVILAAKDALKTTSSQPNDSADAENDQMNTDIVDNMQNIIIELFQQNKDLQEQIWELRETLSNLETKLDY